MILSGFLSLNNKYWAYKKGIFANQQHVNFSKTCRPSKTLMDVALQSLKGKNVTDHIDIS